MTNLIFLRILIVRRPLGFGLFFPVLLVLLASKTFVIITLHFKQLFEMRLAIDLPLKSCVVTKPKEIDIVLSQTKMVWYMVLYVAWYGMWYGKWYVVWYMVWYMVRYMVWYGMWYGMWYCMVCGMVCGMVCSMVCGMVGVWYGMVGNSFKFP